MKFSSLLLVLASATSVASFADVGPSLCDRATDGDPNVVCGEWVPKHGCESTWMEVCKYDHPAGAEYNEYTVREGLTCPQECPPICYGDDVMKMEVSAKGGDMDYDASWVNKFDDAIGTTRITLARRTANNIALISDGIRRCNGGKLPGSNRLLWGTFSYLYICLAPLVCNCL